MKTPSYNLEPPCAATSGSVIGRCGRDKGHHGAHRVTGPEYAAWFPAPPRCPCPTNVDGSCTHHLDNVCSGAEPVACPARDEDQS